VSDELAWLKDVPPESPVDLNQMLPDVLALAGPLATQHQARMQTSVADDLPSLAVHAVALSQALLNLLTVAIHQATGGTVSISARALPLEVEMRILVTPRPGRLRARPDGGRWGPMSTSGHRNIGTSDVG
jgi:signal transduction histidine kinase